MAVPRSLWTLLGTGRNFSKLLKGKEKNWCAWSDCSTYEENKENLGYQDLDIEVDGWSITMEQRVESEKITFSGDRNDFRKWLEKNWKEVHQSYSWRYEQ
jgi:hypothetical protein